MRGLVLILAMLAAPAAAAVIHSETVTSSDGVATVFNSVFAPQTLETGSTWVTISQGQFVRAAWSIPGEVSITSWDPFGDQDDEGNFIPGLIYNDYAYSPFCESSPAAPICGTTPLRTTLSGNVFRADFVRPASYYSCTAVFVVEGDCGASYTFNPVDYDLTVIGVTGDVTFAFHDANPVPEPATWLLLIAGFGLTGSVLRGRRSMLPDASASAHDAAPCNIRPRLIAFLRRVV